MKKKILFDIQSQSDIITNSSTEVFILNNENGAIEELMNELLPSCKHWVDVFKTEEDVKEYLLENFNDYYCEELGLYATDLDLAKEFVQERDDFERINYYVIEEDGTGDDYYNSSEEPDFVDQGE